MFEYQMKGDAEVLNHVTVYFQVVLRAFLRKRTQVGELIRALIEVEKFSLSNFLFR